MDVEAEELWSAHVCMLVSDSRSGLGATFRAMAARELLMSA